MTETTPAGSPQNDESLGVLFATASRDLSTLVRSEIELAKVELAIGVKNGAAGGGDVRDCRVPLPARRGPADHLCRFRPGRGRPGPWRSRSSSLPAC